jgi:transcriptional regulator with XRE-family HTH domain
MEIGERLKKARKALHLTQRDFGGRVGVQDTAISKLESGERNLTEQMSIAVCREFLINETWLRSGEGEMFIESDQTILAALVSEYGLDGVDQKILEVYLRLPASRRAAVRQFIIELSEAIKGEEVSDDIPALVTRSEAMSEEISGDPNFPPITKEEYLRLAAERYEASQRGIASSSTSEKPQSSSTQKQA